MPSVFLATVFLACAAYALPNYDWTVQYMIDTSQSDFGQLQSPYPRDNRGLAISPDGRYLYAGYNNSWNSTGEVRKIDLTVSDYTDAAVANLAGVRGKSIAVDDAGRVYLAEGSTIRIYDADLGVQQLSISTTKCEGVAVTRENGALVLYGSDRTNGTLSRWVLSETGGSVTAAVKAGLDGDGEVALAGALSLRGLDVDPDGRVWIADIDADKVWSVDATGGNLWSLTVADPIDVVIDAGLLYATQYTQRTISVFDRSLLSLEGVITVPWASLELDPDGQSSAGALSGIVLVAGGFYVTNETGQTFGEKSTYGRVDAQSGWLNGTFYTDLYADDNDPILFAQAPVPVPAAVILAALGAGLAVLRRNIVSR
ncbi:MAG: hypothetical protein V2A58_02850 [Planctomycetota bacterium]